MIRHIFFTALLLHLFLCDARAQKMSLHILIRASDTRHITPAMVCIKGLTDSITYIPPGMIAPEASFPDLFYKGISFTDGSGFIGPVRRMLGKGAVNGQRTYVYGNNPTLPYWSDSVMYQTSGEFSIDLLPGRYTISIEHGNEYVPVKQIISLSGKRSRSTKEFYLHRWIDLPRRGWYSGDVHTHHPLNKGSFRKYMIQMAAAEDLHAVNVLQMGDRNSLYFEPEGYGKTYRVQQGNYFLATGQEEPRSEYGHVIGLNIDTLARDTSHYNYYDIVFNKLHRSSHSLAGFAHFAYGGEGVTPGLAMHAPSGAIDFVELMQNTQINTEDYYDYLNLGFHFAAAYGSDFPWGSTIGDGRVFVYTGKEFSADKWFAGLKAGNTFVSNGPALILEADGQIPGSVIKKDSGAVIVIQVTALSNKTIGVIDRIQLVGGDGVLAEGSNLSHSDSVSLQYTHTVKASGWIVARAYCKNGALAHTSPVYFAANGAPTVNRNKAPAIVKKLTGILEDARKKESLKAKPDPGIITRIDSALTWYRQLL